MEEDNYSVYDLLYKHVAFTAEWREAKQSEYPDDRRNTTAAAELSRLADQLCALRRDHPLVARYLAYYRDHSDALEDLPEFESECTRRVGFQGSHESAFFKEVLEECERLAGPMKPTAVG